MRSLVFALLIMTGATSAASWADAAEKLRVFTWSGYVLPGEVDAVNKILKDQNYDITVEVISPWAENPDQMFEIIRDGKADVAFVSLHFIKMQHGKIANLLQPINVNSPRLTNYAKLSTNLTSIPIGMEDGKPLYIPYGGGAFGIWANMNKLAETDVPKSIKDIFDPKWTGKISLCKGYPQPNIAFVLMALDKPPKYFNDLVLAGKRDEALKAADKDGEIQKKFNALYKQAGSFWDSAPTMSQDFLLVYSYGPEIGEANAKGGNWKLVNFKEGNTVWLDNINFVKGLSGKKLEAAEIFANYMIGKEVQGRVVKGLSMVAVSTLVDSNPLVDNNPNFFSNDMFWPPYEASADNLVKMMSDEAMKAAGQ